MPIRYELRFEAFDPQDVEAISLAFEDALNELGLIDRTDPVVVVIAKRTIEFAKKGELDRFRLRELVVKSFRS
jgi:hypothetical protein